MRSRVLVVDDDPLIRIVSQRTLERAGFEAIVAGSIRETFERLGTGLLEAALLDYFLGEGECGCDLIDPLRARYPTIRIVVLSGLGVLAGVIDHAHAAGADRVGSKVSPDWVALAGPDPVSPARPPRHEGGARGANPQDGHGRARAHVDLARLKREVIHGAFLVHRRNVSATARALHLQRSTVQRLLRTMPLAGAGDDEPE